MKKKTTLVDTSVACFSNEMCDLVYLTAEGSLNSEWAQVERDVWLLLLPPLVLRVPNTIRLFVKSSLIPLGA